MTQRMQDLAAEIVRLQTELDQEIETRRKILGSRLKDQIGEFEQGIIAEHRRLRMSVMTFLAQSPISVVVTAPMIYSLIVPFLIMDMWVSLYQAICFRIYRIPQVHRGRYIAFDRKHLAYLNWIETLNCLYCGYANGVIAYVREIASRTEQYWCPIKHAARITDPHRRYYAFLEYGDADGYRTRLDQFRERLRSDAAPGSDAP
jgi:hypothetical protein